MKSLFVIESPIHATATIFMDLQLHTPSALLNDAVKLINWRYLACGDALSFLHTASQTMQFGCVPAKNNTGALAEHLPQLITQPLNSVPERRTTH